LTTYETTTTTTAAAMTTKSYNFKALVVVVAFPYRK